MGLHAAIVVKEFNIYGFKCRGVFASARILKGERVWWLVAGEEASSLVLTRAQIEAHPQADTLKTYSYMIGAQLTPKGQKKFARKKKKIHFFSPCFTTAR